MILGTTPFGAGVLAGDSDINYLVSFAATPDASTASVTISLSGLDFSQFVTILRTTPDGASVPVRGANERATFSGAGYTLGTNLLDANASSFEASIAEWAAGTNCTSIAQSGAFAYSGASSMLMTATASGTVNTSHGSNTLPVTAGKTYMFTYWVYTANPSRTAQLQIDYYNGAGGVHIATDSLSAQGIPPVVLTAGSWTQVTIITTVPIGANYANIIVQPIAATGGDLFYVDNVFFGTYSFVATTSGTFNVTDYECPLNTSVTYTAEVGLLINGVPTVLYTAVSGSVEVVVPDGTVWIKNVLLPGLNLQTTISSMSDAVLTARTQASYVIGRRNPIILVDAMGGRQGTITFLTGTLADKETFVDLLSDASSSVLFLQVAAVDGFDDMYFSVSGSVTENRPSSAAYDSNRLWPVTYLEVDYPADSQTTLATNTWLQVLGWNSWLDLYNQRPSWASILTSPFGTYPGDTP